MITITLSEQRWAYKKNESELRVRIAVSSQGRIISEVFASSWEEAIDEVRATVADPPAEPPPPRSCRTTT